MTAEALLRNVGPANEGWVNDRYIVGRILGTGATSEVRSGWDRRLDRSVAIKLLRTELAGDPVVRRRFAEEARAAARLSHPNVVAVFDSSEPEGPDPAYIVMERLPGESLRSTLEHGPLAVAEVRDLAVQMLSALAAGAASGLLHCDIKPGNILATGDGRWKLADFGIARIVDSAAREDTVTVAAGPEDTMAGLVMGTPAYLAPERLCGLPPTESSDVFSLGVVLFEALTGCRPFATTGSYPWSTALSGEAAPPVRTLRTDVDAQLAAVIDRAVRLQPADRYATTAEMAADLAAGPDRHRDPAVVPRSRAARRLVTGAVAGATGAAVSLVLITAGGPDHPARAGTQPPPAAATTVPAAPVTTVPVRASAPDPTMAPPAVAAAPRVNDATARPTRPPAPARTAPPRAPRPAVHPAKRPHPPKPR